MLKGIERELNNVNVRLVGVAGKKISAAWSKGLADADALAKKAGVAGEPGSPAVGSFSLVDSSRAKVLVRETAGDLNKAVNSIRDTTRRLVRQTQAIGVDDKKLKQIFAGGTIEGTPTATLQQFKKEVRTAAVDGKIVTVNTRTGVEMHFKPDDYAELVFQTKQAEATNIATLERLQSRKMFYVKIIGSHSANFCTAFVDKVFYTGPGEDPLGQFPNVRSLPRGGPPFHPRCTKRYTAFSPSLASAEEIEKAKLLPHEKELLNKPAAEAQKAYSANEPTKPDRSPVPGRTNQDPEPTIVLLGGVVEVPSVIELPKSGETAAAMRSALESVAKVHTLPSIVRSIPLKVVSNARFEGAFDPKDWVLQIRAGGQFKKTTLTHELGHYFEHQVLGGMDAAVKHPAFSGWYQAVKGTETIRKTSEMLQLVRLRGRPEDAGFYRHLAYLLRPHEVFARSYSQWIAQATSDLDMLQETRMVHVGTRPPEQWDYDEFAPIEVAFQQAFGQLGLLK